MTTPLPGPLPDSVDVVVVGAGGAGMTAALAAKKRGLDTVLIEKSSYFGGSTARSGGGVWSPTLKATFIPIRPRMAPRSRRKRHRPAAATTCLPSACRY